VEFIFIFFMSFTPELVPFLVMNPSGDTDSEEFMFSAEMQR